MSTQIIREALKRAETVLNVAWSRIESFGDLEGTEKTSSLCEQQAGGQGEPLLEKLLDSQDIHVNR